MSHTVEVVANVEGRLVAERLEGHGVLIVCRADSVDMSADIMKPVEDALAAAQCRSKGVHRHLPSVHLLGGRPGVESAYKLWDKCPGPGAFGHVCGHEPALQV